jgi:Tfp pilus assembly protein PilF
MRRRPNCLRGILALGLAALWGSGCKTVPEPKPEPPPQEARAELPEPPEETPELPEGALAASQPEEEVKLLDPAIRAAFEEGMRAAMEGDPVRALAQFKAAASSDPRTYWAHYNLALLQERNQDFEAAERSYLTALGMRPKADRVAENYAKLMVRQGRASEAEIELKRRIAGAPDSIGLRNALAWTLASEEKLDAAAGEAKKVLKADEQNAVAMYVLANVYLKEGRSELATMMLENAALIDKARAEIPNLQGVILLGQNKKAAAMEKFRQAAFLREDFPEAHNNLGAMLLAAQSFPEAVKELELAVRNAPNFAAAHVNLGNAYRGAGELERARQEYDLALKLDPKLASEIYFNFAVLYMDAETGLGEVAQRMEQAIAYLNKVKEAGRGDETVEQYLKDASKAIEKEKRRKEREEKERLRKAKKAEEEAKAKKTEEEAAPLSNSTPPGAGGKLE